MFYKDMSDYQYLLKKPLVAVQNVGWLEKDYQYKTGKVNSEFLSKLACIIVGNDIFNAQVNMIRCMHPCALSDCALKDISCGNSLKGNLGSAEIWIPSPGKRYFAAPTMIYHYIEKHNYLPPKQFITAVMAFDLELPYQAEDIYSDLIRGHF